MTTQGQWECDEGWEERDDRDYKEFRRKFLRVVYNIILIVLMDLCLHTHIEACITYFKRVSLLLITHQ